MHKKSKQELAAILFTDIEGYSLISNNDQELGLQMAQAHRDVIENCAQAFSGECINFYGDGSLSIFHSAKDALFSAIEMQKKFCSEHEVPVRIGIHIGEVVRDKNSAYGDAINIASRIQTLAPKGGILVSEAVKKAIGKQKGIELKGIGKEFVKNIPAPINLFYVSHPDIAVPDKAKLHARARNQNGNSAAKKSPSQSLRFILLVAVLSLLYYFLVIDKRNEIPADFYSEKLAVLPFENLTGIPGDSTIGIYVANLISESLRELDGTNIISSLSLDRYRSTLEASFYPIGKVPRFSKAVNLIHGQYFKENDNILFKASLINLKTGGIIHVFPEERSKYHNRKVAIDRMNGRIMGYWGSRKESIISSPNYKGWKYYKLALDNWNGDKWDTIAASYLEKSIQSDSTFFDAYNLKFDVLKNMGEDQQLRDWNEFIMKKFPIEELSERHQNTIRYNEAEVNRDFALAFQYYEKEFDYDKEDLFSSLNMGVLAMEYINDPSLTQDILSYVDRDSINYFASPYFLQRLDIDLRSLLDLQKYEDVHHVINLYPSKITRRSRNQLILRAYIACRDEKNFSGRLRKLQFELDDWDLANLKYLAAKDAKVLRWDSMSLVLSSEAFMYFKNKETHRSVQLLYLMEEYEEALYLATQRWKADSNRINDHILMALCNFKLQKTETGKSLTKDIEKELANARNEFGYRPYLLSYLYVANGDYPRAFESLKQSIKEGKKFYLGRFQWDVFLQPLHEMEDFQNIIHPLR